VVTAFDPAHDACYVLDIAARRAELPRILCCAQLSTTAAGFREASAAVRRLLLLRLR
jgi:hypothetical protein